MDKTNLQVVRESFGRVSYSHKTHEKDAEIKSCYAIFIKWVNIALISITTGSLLSTLFSGHNLLVLSAVFSTITLGFNIFQLSFNPEMEAERHKQVASSLWLMREKYVCLMADIINSNINKSEIIKRRDELINELDIIYKSAPATSSWAYKKAQKALKIDEELTFTDKEINQFLPASLHISSSKGK